MSYLKLLTHRCDIFHLVQDEKERGYGLPSKKGEEYPAEPDHAGVKSYWSERNQTITQGEPNNMIIQSYNVHFPIKADVRVNDKVMWDGISFTLQKPRIIRNHHIEAVAVRSDNL